MTSVSATEALETCHSKAKSTATATVPEKAFSRAVGAGSSGSKQPPAKARLAKAATIPEKVTAIPEKAASRAVGAGSKAPPTALKPKPPEEQPPRQLVRPQEPKFSPPDFYEAASTKGQVVPPPPRVKPKVVAPPPKQPESVPKVAPPKQSLNHSAVLPPGCIYFNWIIIEN